MDSDRFDALSRTLTAHHSRRAALGVLLAGGLAALLGLPPEEAGAHNPIAACKRLPDLRQRRRCTRQARAHYRTCHPEPRTTTCRGRCDTVRNRCGTKVFCRCPAGSICLGNGSCTFTCKTCPPRCDCHPYSEIGGNETCFPPNGFTCEDSPQSCVSTADCPVGRACQRTGCLPGIAPYVYRCVPLCQP